MTTILYPTRGGESSYPNHDRVFSLAREQEADLVLLYVSNVHFLDRLPFRVPVELVEAEMDKLGEFLLAMVQERAKKAGVQADAEVRHGSFRQALLEVIQDREITTVVLGTPGGETAITSTDYLDSVIQFLKDETRVEMIMVNEGGIVQ